MSGVRSILLFTLSYLNSVQGARSGSRKKPRAWGEHSVLSARISGTQLRTDDLSEAGIRT